MNFKDRLDTKWWVFQQLCQKKAPCYEGVEVRYMGG